MQELLFRQHALIVLSMVLISAPLYGQEATEQTEPSASVQDLEREAMTAIEACASDISRFCDDVTPGEGRILACVYGYADQVTPACEDSIRAWRGPDWQREFQTTQIYPTLEEHADLSDVGGTRPRRAQYRR
jgi:hypothetical protein